MTLPIPSNVFSDGQLINEALLYANVFAPINTIYQLAQASGGFLLAETDGTGSTTMSTGPGSTRYLVGTSGATFVLSAQRRVRIAVGANRYTSGSATGLYRLEVGYVAGSSATLSGATFLTSNQAATTTTGSAGAMSINTEHSVLLAAGTWTAFPAATKVNSGSATDTVAGGYTAVYDAGNV